jgi:hypothetical protein
MAAGDTSLQSGTLDIQSEVGVGTTIRVNLPLPRQTSAGPEDAKAVA